MSIAFGKRYPALDGNARRVLGRIFDPNDEKELRKIAMKLVPTVRPGYFNQGLMELGAMICAPKKPRCTECPVAADCASRIKITPTKPIPAKRKYRNIIWPLAIVRNNGKILLHRRAANEVLAGLWELPGGEKAKAEGARASLERHLGELNGSLTRDIRIGEVCHSITTRKIRAPIFLFDVQPYFKACLKGSRWHWHSPDALHRLPVSSMTRKAVQVLSLYEKSAL
jgi:A/G-specific adenine glycosylase